MTPEERQAADEAFTALQSRVTSLEATLQKYEDVLNFMLTNHPFFTNLTAQLEERFVSVESQIAALSSLSNPVGRSELTRTLATYRDDMLASMKAMIEVSPAKSSTSSSPKFEAPAVFSGKREDWKAFQSRLELYFLNTASLYPTDANKIMFAISRLGDTPAFKYMEKYIPSFKLPEEERPNLICQLDVFFKSMSKTFGVTNAHVLAESQLRGLSQRGSALDYTNKFTTLAADTKWNDAAMISQYRLGLKTTVQDIMANQEEPDTFAEFSQLAIDIDNRQYGYAITKSTSRSSTTRPSSTSTAPQRTAPPPPPASSPSMAMDLSQAQHRSIDTQEKQRREDNGLCRYCGADDHWAKDCPKKSKFTPKPFSKPTQSIAAVQTSPDVVFELGKDNA
jgi:hypothetical protein